MVNEIRRYLGCYGQMNAATETLISDCINELSPHKNGLFVYEIFPVTTLANGIAVADSAVILRGGDIKNHLAHSQKVAVMAATLGASVDFLISKYTKTNLARAVVLDACATAMVEAVCDNAQSEIANLAQAENKFATPRFSPGYGDFPIESQNEILELIKAPKKIGLTATAESVMIPSKSVSAIVGFSDIFQELCENKCKTCKNRAHCAFKKE